MVAGCDQLREAKFRSMQQAGIRARDEAARDVWLVGSICVLTVFLGIGVAIWLARSVLVPVHELTAAAEEIRHGNFERRVRFLSTDELGELAGGFNRMAEALTSYRRSSLGEVLAAKNTLEVTLKALPNAVLVFAPDGTLAALNPPARVILIALDAANAVHLSSMPFRPEHRESIRLALNGQSSPARCMDFRESLSVTVEGKPRRFLVTAVPVAEFVPGQFGAAVVLDDITEFARLDELRAELIGVASHELRSPLTALRMNLLMLSEAASDLPRRQQQLLAAAVEGCEELGLTIEELLDVTRIEAGQLRLHRSPVEMGSVVAAVCTSLQTRYDDAQVRLKVVAPPEPLLLLGDPVRLQSVLSNLLTNALKYSPPGATVEIAMASRQNAQGDSPKAVQITVTDQGVGVPEEYRERIFEKFFRVEHHLPSCGKDVRGTGIGLYLCREIVHSHGGTIVCLPGPEGIGTRLAIWLPHQA
jgi:NtrC-family two-component system sensor histidine kinase KinB